MCACICFQQILHNCCKRSLKACIPLHCVIMVYALQVFFERMLHNCCKRSSKDCISPWQELGVVLDSYKTIRAKDCSKVIKLGTDWCIAITLCYVVCNVHFIS